MANQHRPDPNEVLFNYDRAMAQMDEYKLDAIVGATFTNAYYMSGVHTIYDDWPWVEPYQAAIVCRDEAKPPTLVTMTMFLPSLVGGVPTWMPNVRLYDWLAIDKTLEPPDTESALVAEIGRFIDDHASGDVEKNLVDATVGAFKQLGLTKGRIGFDDLRLANYIKEELPDIEIVDAFKMIMNVRKARTPQELRMLSYSARVNHLGLEAVIEAMRPGMKWSELAYLFKETWIKHGGSTVSDKGLFWGGAYKGQYIPDAFYLPDNDFVLEEGKYYLLEGEGQVQQYHADCNRTLFLGEPPKEYLDGVDAIMRAYQAIEKPLRPGVSTAEVYRAALGVIFEHGIPFPRKTAVATHGVGLEFVEWYGKYPTQRAIPESYIVEEGVTVGMDVLYYGHTLGTFHMENGLMIAEDGPRSFYAPPNTETILPAGLIVKDGNSTDCYCPSDVKLFMEKGIDEKFVMKGSPVPSWCHPDVNGQQISAAAE